MTPEERKVVDELHERVEHLEELIALHTRQLAKAPAPEQAKEKGGRWLDHARYANACAGKCKGRVEAGERCWYVPRSATTKAAIYHEACAPAEAKAKTNGRVKAAA